MTEIAGCRFAPRCPFAIAQCRVEAPQLVDLGAGHEAACWRASLDGYTLPGVEATVRDLEVTV